MFYPALTRRKAYKTKKDGGYFTSYNTYYEEIKEDCYERCVYCDITLPEHGFEGMHLDHFRPQHSFKELSNDPNNLVLACLKCNVLKSKHWPISKDEGVSHNGKIGFIDPFEERVSDYIRVKGDGQVESKGGPSEYIIELLSLNRPGRIQSRRRRIHLSRINDLLDETGLRIDALADKICEPGIDLESIKQEIQQLRIIQCELQGLRL